MNRRALIAAGLAAPWLSSCNMMATSSLRYRLRMKFAAGGEKKIGDSVTEIRWRDNRIFGVGTPGPEFMAKVWGEAVVVDLGRPHGYLFALLHENSPVDMARDVLARGIHDSSSIDSPEEFFAALRQVQVEVPLFRPDLPMLVAFGDLADPKSVYEVKYDELAGRYDGAVIFIGASVQQTQKKVTERIRQILPWIDSVSEGYLGGNRYDTAAGRHQLANRLHQGDFVRSGA